uniref:Uncharacterized protein n=1 Tax=Physcomitrium patens TaxID=3218 RepID=A0A2K1KJN0_PHYPA|nr:hypothetical protein PHYPA_007663 [Physcomitrium patens]
MFLASTKNTKASVTGGESGFHRSVQTKFSYQKPSHDSGNEAKILLMCVGAFRLSAEQKFQKLLRQLKAYFCSLRSSCLQGHEAEKRKKGGSVYVWGKGFFDSGFQGMEGFGRGIVWHHYLSLSEQGSRF